MAVVPGRSQRWLPAPGEQRASRQQNRRGGAFARADGERKLRRAEAGAPRQARERTARVRARVCTCSMRTGIARAAAGPTEAGPQARQPAGLGGTPADDGLVSLGGEEVGDEVDRGMDRLARVLVYRGASIVMYSLGRGGVRAEWNVAGLSC